MYGEYLLDRVVYGIRERQKNAYVPLDERLQLPASKCSYLLQDWNQSLAVEMLYKQVSAATPSWRYWCLRFGKLARPPRRLKAKRSWWPRWTCKGVVMRKASAQTDVKQERIDVCKATMCAEENKTNKHHFFRNGKVQKGPGVVHHRGHCCEIGACSPGRGSVCQEK